MKMPLRLASAVAAAVGLGLSMPLFAADKPADAKQALAQCDGLKGEERTKCRKEARATDSQGSGKAKGAQATGSSEIGGADKMQKSPTGADREKSTLPTAPPKAAAETAEGKGASKVDRASDKGGAKSPAPSKGTPETAGDDKKGKDSMAK